MQFETVYPFLLLIAPFAIAFGMEAAAIYLFRLNRLLTSVGNSIIINLFSLPILFGSSMLLGKLGYQFNGLRLPVQVIFFLWWLSIISDGLLLQLFTKCTDKKTVYLCSIVMNTASYLFLYFFISNSQ